MKSIKAKKISTKIIAKHCSFNGIKFDSLQERDFYVRLIRIFGDTNVIRCGRVEILPSTAISPSISWDVDFKVYHRGRSFLVEYKGQINGRRDDHREFFLKLTLLRMVAQRDIIVFSPDSICPKWQTQDGLKPCPDFYGCNNLTDGEIYLIFDNKVNKDLQNV